MPRVILILCLIFSMVFISSCYSKSDINIVEVLGRTEDQLREFDGVKTTASAFDGTSNIKFRFMVEGRPSKVEAEKLFNKLLNTIATNSNRQDLWNYYNAYFDIKSYDYGVIYEAVKPANDSLKITELAPGQTVNIGDRHEEIRLENPKAEGIVTSDEYTLLDIVIENRDKDKIKPQKRDWWNETPKNDKEKAIFESVKVEKEYLEQLGSLEELIKEKKLKNEDTRSLEDEFSQLMELWLNKKAETVKLMGEDGD